MGNDMKIKDKILSIPRKEFNLEEVHRVATACEAAKNYSITSPDLAKNNVQVANKISVGKTLKKPQLNFKDSNVVGSSKIKAMKDGCLCAIQMKHVHTSKQNAIIVEPLDTSRGLAHKT